MVENGTCAVCRSPTAQRCSGCQAVHYCSREHQKVAWKHHKNQCSPVKIKRDVKLGRYLESTRTLKAGEVVLKEKPLITGPSQVTPPVCLGCYVLLEKGKVVTCDKCGWPFCSLECVTKEVHKPECYYTQARGAKVNITDFEVPHPSYQCITVLRCLYQRDHNKPLWKKLMSLEAHCEQRKDTEKWENDRKMVLKVIWNFFNLDGLFNEYEIMKCCGILQINGHEVPLTEPEYLAVFDIISLVEHNCKANCNKSFTSDGEMVLHCGREVRARSHVSVCYTDPLWGSEARRHHLADTKYFECACARCSDVTEMGTMFSAVKCNKNGCKGFLLPETFLVPIIYKTPNAESNTLNLYNKEWTCSVCDNVVKDVVIQQLLENIGKGIFKMKKNDVDACEKMLEHCATYLHPNHFYMADLMIALSQMIGQQHRDPLSTIPDDKLLLKTQLSRKIADLLVVLTPAETRLRGTLLYELHAVLAESGRRRSAEDGPTSMLGFITESRKALAQALRLLRHEPPELPEGRLALQASDNLAQLDDLIRTLTSAMPSPL